MLKKAQFLDQHFIEEKGMMIFQHMTKDVCTKGDIIVNIRYDKPTRSYPTPTRISESPKFLKPKNCNPTLNPQVLTRNPKPETPILNPQPETMKTMKMTMKPKPRDHDLSTRNPKP